MRIGNRSSGFAGAARMLVLSSLAVLTACGGGNSGAENESGQPIVGVQSSGVGETIAPENQRVIPTSESYPYRVNGQFASVLKDCALADLEEICSLAKLPYIGQSSSAPVVEDIMQRVLVTHDWMAVRFEQLLRVLPADILTLFKPLTSIVIGSEIRPSGFSAVRGRLRLDPRYLWLGVAEKRTVSTNSDPRAEFGASLLFTPLNRVMIGDEYAYYSWSVTDDEERALGDLEIAFARLLYHELAHANDYVQAGELASLSNELTPRQVVAQLAEVRVSTLLYSDEALTAQRSYLYGLAGVRYFDDEASDFQNTLLADYVGSEMDNEGKASFYSYSTVREDVAELFSTTMLKYHYGADTHVGFADKPSNHPDASCDSYLVAWGLRNRLASPLVAARAEFVANKILPASVQRSNFFATGLGQAVPLRAGEGWCSTRYQNSRLAKSGIADRELINHEWIIDIDEQ